MTVKIALVGAMHVGKTTLLEALRQQCFTESAYPLRIGFVPESARQILDENPAIHWRSEELQDLIQNRLFELEDTAEAFRYELTICDRSALDVVVFSDVRRFSCYDRVLAEAAVRLRSYAHFYLLDNDDVFVNWSKERFLEREALQESFKRQLNAFQLPWTFLSGSVEQRLGKIVADWPILS